MGDRRAIEARAVQPEGSVVREGEALLGAAEDALVQAPVVVDVVIGAPAACADEAIPMNVSAAIRA